MLSLLSVVASFLALPVQSRWDPPFKAVPAPANYQRYLPRLDSDGVGIFVDRDQITLIGKGKENPLVAPGWLDTPFVRDEAQDLWVAQVQMKGWDRAFFTYGVKHGTQTTNRLFRAAHAPRAPKAAEKLAGTLRTYTIASKALGESRDVMVYLPPNAQPGLSVVYMADGQSSKGFAEVIEPLILEKRIAPTALVGIFHGPYTGDIKNYEPEKDFRAREYLKVVDPDRFQQHLKFVADEVLPWAEKELGVSQDPRKRALMGYSNGGAFALTASIERPDLFGHILPFSIAVIDLQDLKKGAEGKRLPTYWMAAGTLEPFIVNTDAAQKVVNPFARRVHLDHYVTGHDQAFWRLAFAKSLPAIFPSQSR